MPSLFSDIYGKVNCIEKSFRVLFNQFHFRKCGKGSGLFPGRRRVFKYEFAGSGEKKRGVCMGAGLRRGVVALALLAGGAWGFVQPAMAVESLTSVLAAAYASNPELRAERARQRATDEGVPQALSGWRPTITATGDLGHVDATTRAKTGIKTYDKRNPRGFGISLNQSLFNGFSTVYNTKQAKAGVLAGRHVLLNVEQNILLNAATAYMDVLRDAAILKLQRNNVKVLRRQLNDTEARFNVGELTRTDKAQARARYSRAISEAHRASGNLASSRAVFRQVVGHSPGTLSKARLKPRNLPRSRAEAFRIAERSHPAILAAMYNEESARYAVRATKGELYPRITVEARYDRRYDSSAFTNRTDSASITGRLTIPIYQGGVVYSRVRQAKQTRAQRRLELDKVRYEVRAAVASAWEGLRSALSQIRAEQQQIRATRIALDGVRQEAKVGQRTTQDVLDAFQAHLNAQVSLVIAQRNATVAAYSLQAAIGRLTARHLKLPVRYYDPAVNYERVRGKWFGTDIGKGQ